MDLTALGFDEWFVRKQAELCGTEMPVARVTAVDRESYTLRNEHGEVSGELAGRYLHVAESPADRPCVGDWVCVQYHDSGSHGIIHRMLPRKTFLRRKTPGKNVDFQMIAANIDVAFLVQSCHFDFNVRRLERYLVMVSEGHIEPVIILTKTDLIGEAELAQLVEKIRISGIDAPIVALSSVTGEGIDQIRQRMVSGKTYCLLGSSGVGKTTLINRLKSDACLETREVSESGEGRHTTTRRHLVVLDNGALLIDMPGMRELGVIGASDGIDDSFADIAGFSKQCRFADCSHTNEPGCAVLSAVENGELDANHLENYRKLKKESEFHEMSYVEKRKKDKAFGRFVRQVIKDKSK